MNNEESRINSWRVLQHNINQHFATEFIYVWYFEYSGIGINQDWWNTNGDKFLMGVKKWFQIPIWTGDKKLKDGLRLKGFQDFYNQ